MDTLTHALSGALVARALGSDAPRSGQLPPRLRMWIGFWAAAFPDMDFVLMFLDPLTYMTEHRGLTHSIFLLPVWALGLAHLFARIVRGGYSWHAFVTVCAAGIGAHIAGDVITSWGTMIYAPFSHVRVAFPATFIIDPYFTLIIVAGLVASEIAQAARPTAIAGLVTLATYVGFQWQLHERAVALGEAYAAREQLHEPVVHALPQPFSPFHWMIAVADDRAYHVTYISLTRTEVREAPSVDAFWMWRAWNSYQPVSAAVWKQVARFGPPLEANLASEVWNLPGLKPYRDFALLPTLYRVDRIESKLCAWFSDLRFALVGRDAIFRYGACRAPEWPWRVYHLKTGLDGRELAEPIGAMQVR